jgi:hypothetical protein
MYLEPYIPVASYLAPAAVLAVFMRALEHRFVLFWLITLPGTAAHEICHFVAGGLTNAKPTGLSLWPSRVKDGYILGSVTFANLRWYNAAVACLAPILLLPLALGYAYFRTLGGWFFEPWDLLRWYLLSGTVLSAWPSSIDWRLSFRSWPLGVAAFTAAYLFLNR